MSFPKFLYILGYAFCAQNPLHSFFYKGEKLPLDARCTGIYLGFLITFIFWLWNRKKKAYCPPSLGIIVFLLLFILYFTFDGFSSVLHAGYVTNLTRFFSGLFFGKALGLLLMMVISHSFWGNLKNKQKIIRWQEFVILASINLLLFFLAFFEISFFFYLVGWLSILGLVILLLTLNMAFLLQIPLFSKSYRYVTKIKLTIDSILFSLIEIVGLIFLRTVLINFK